MEQFKNAFVCIPTIILDDTALTNNEKILYAFISALSNKYGYCFASNSYLAKKINAGESTLRRWLKSLIDKNYIISEITYKENSKEIKSRKLRLSAIKGMLADEQEIYCNEQGVCSEMSIGMLKNELDNNISINKISMNKKEEIYKEEKSSFDEMMEEIEQAKKKLSRQEKSKQKFIPPSLDEIKKYCEQRKNNVDAKRFFDYYEANDWKDSRNEPVKNWKQKMIANWESKTANHTNTSLEQKEENTRYVPTEEETKEMFLKYREKFNDYAIRQILIEDTNCNEALVNQLIEEIPFKDAE